MKKMKVIVFVIVICFTWGCMAKPLFVGPTDCARCFSKIYPDGAVEVRADMVPFLNDREKNKEPQVLAGDRVDSYFEYHLSYSNVYQNYLESRKLEKTYKRKKTRRNILFGSVGLAAGVALVASAFSSHDNEKPETSEALLSTGVSIGIFALLLSPYISTFRRLDRIEKEKFKALKIESLKQFNEEMSEIEREKIIYRQDN